MNAHTSREYTCFTSHCLANDIERSVDSLADVLLNSKLSRHDIEAERSTILREADEVIIIKQFQTYITVGCNKY